MNTALRRVALVGLVVGISACGGSGGGSSPSGPSQTVNHPPTVTGVTINPGFGIASFSTFAMSATASDADNDPLNYTWDFGDGTTASGSSVSKTYQGGGAMNVRVTASDGKSTGSDTRTINVGSMTGRWKLTTIACVGQNQSFTMDLVQTGSTVTGTFSMPDGFCNGQRGLTGQTDPAEPGKIDANGYLVIRFKAGIFLDFYFKGTMQAPGNKVVGGVFQSGFGGDATTLDKIG